MIRLRVDSADSSIGSLAHWSFCLTNSDTATRLGEVGF